MSNRPNRKHKHAVRPSIKTVQIPEHLGILTHDCETTDLEELAATLLKSSNPGGIADKLITIATDKSYANERGKGRDKPVNFTDLRALVTLSYMGEYGFARRDQAYTLLSEGDEYSHETASEVCSRWGEMILGDLELLLEGASGDNNPAVYITQSLSAMVIQNETLTPAVCELLLRVLRGKNNCPETVSWLVLALIDLDCTCNSDEIISIMRKKGTDDEILSEQEAVDELNKLP